MAGDEEIPIVAKRQDNQYIEPREGDVKYILADSDLGKGEKDLDQAGLIRGFDGEAFERVYISNCINYHGTPEMEGSIPLSNKFWEQPFKYGTTPFPYITQSARVQARCRHRSR